MIYKPDPIKILILICIFVAGMVLGGILKQPVEVEKTVEAEEMVGAKEPTNIADVIRGDCKKTEYINVGTICGEYDSDIPLNIKNAKKVILDNQEFNVETIKKDNVPVKIYVR